METHSSVLPKYKNKSSSNSLRLALESRLVFDGHDCDGCRSSTRKAVDSQVNANTSEAAPPPSEPNVDFVPEDFQQRSEPLHEQHVIVDTMANGILLDAPAAETPHELVFVDARVKDLQSFLPERTSEIILLDPERDGVEQIAAALAGRTGINVIHILSRGDAGQLYLGDSTLDVHSISGEHADELANIKAALSNNADILVYGCDVAAGAQGQAFVTALAAATGADVAASIDLTGNADLGGDWQLEASTGNIEAKTLAFTDYQGLLDAPTITDSVITTRSTPEDTNLNITGITIADADGDNQFVALSIPDGVITLTAGSGVAGLAGEGTGAVTFNGTLAQVNAAINGIIFTPAANYSGAASVTLTTHDGTTTAGSTINITVLPVNDAPIATPDLIDITEDVDSVNGNVLTNDTDPNSPDTEVVQGVAPGTVAGPLTGGYNNPIAGDYGTFTLNSDGTYNYMLDNSKPAVQELAAGQTVTDIFTYTMKDSAGATSTANITVTVTGANDAPLADISPILKMLVIPENATEAENPGVLISTLLVDVAGRALGVCLTYPA